VQRLDIVNALTNLGRVRRAYLREKNALNLRILGLIRSELGFVAGKDVDKATEKSNKKIKTRSDKILAALLKRNPEKLKDEDREVYDYMVGIGTGFLIAMSALLEAKDAIEQQMTAVGKKLPEAEWWASHLGLSYLGFALVISDTGDLSRFTKESQLWKRMGLAVINGERQRRVAGNPELAIEHGYNSDRRTTMWVIMDSFMRNRNKECYADHPWMNLFRTYKANQLAQEGCIPAKAEERAKRRLSKRILRDLFIEWNKNTVVLKKAA